VIDLRKDIAARQQCCARYCLEDTCSIFILKIQDSILLILCLELSSRYFWKVYCTTLPSRRFKCEISWNKVEIFVVEFNYGCVRKWCLYSCRPISLHCTGLRQLKVIFAAEKNVFIASTVNDFPTKWSRYSMKWHANNNIFPKIHWNNWFSLKLFLKITEIIGLFSTLSSHIMSDHLFNNNSLIIIILKIINNNNYYNQGRIQTFRPPLPPLIQLWLWERVMRLRCEIELQLNSCNTSHGDHTRTPSFSDVLLFIPVYCLILKFRKLHP